MQAVYQVARLVPLDAGGVETAIRWTFAGARAALWYGFFVALIMAELFAARVMRRVVEASLRRPSLRELEAMLAVPLGDPGLRLLFWRSGDREWVDGDGVPTEPSAGRVLTAVERDGRPAVAIIHDAQLAEDPELVRAAGAVALLAQENAELEEGWNDALRELRDSRARIAAAGAVERRALERDLHDGAQQRLIAVLLNLALVAETLPNGSDASKRLAGIESEVEAALAELRQLGHGIYPPQLAATGLVGALEVVANRSAGAIAVAGDGVGRFGPEVESAVYFCCLEASQNAMKHAGAGARISIELQATDRVLLFHVSDDGAGFEASAAHEGVGLRNMRDRLDALGGRLEITSTPGRGTAIAGALPIPSPGRRAP